MPVTVQYSARFAVRVVVALAAVLAALAIGGSTAKADTIGWNSFAAPDGSGPALSDGDKITLETQSGVAPAGFVEVRLATIDGMTWRKGIEVDKRARGCGLFGCWTEDRLIAGMYLQDHDHGPISRLVSVGDALNQLGFGRLRFGKAKGFGIYHNNVHELRFDTAHVVSGNRYTFTWVTD
jgi:hypothetical protein